MIRLNYKEYGSGEEVLIVLHGFLGSLDNWHTLASEWGNKGLHVYTLDQRNHGRSPHTEEHSIALMAQDLKDFMEQQGIATASLLGHSMGGKVAMAFALSYPLLVKKLIIADMGPRAYKHGHEDVFNAIMNVDLGVVQSRKEAEEAMKTYLGDNGTRQFLMKSLDRKEDGTYQWKFNFDVLRRDYEDLIRETVADHAYTGETLFLKGGLSVYIKEEDVPGIRRLFPHALIQTIEQAGHWLHADQPAAFSEAVLRFLNPGLN